MITVISMQPNQEHHIRSNVQDVVYQWLGAIGRWQIYVCLAVFAVKFSVAWHQLGIVVLAPPVDFNCSDWALDRCSSECPSHVFDKTVFEQTIVTEWDLVCDRSQLASLAQLTFMLGILFGNLVFGWLADRYGRRKPLVGAVVLQVVSGVVVSFAPWLWLFMLLRFVCAFATGGTMLTSFILVTEIVGTRWRTAVGVLFQFPFQLGHASLGGFGYLLRDWHDFQVAISVPSVLLISYYWILPESPRWLASVGRTEEAKKVLEKAVRFNKLSIPEKGSYAQELLEQCSLKENTAGGNIFDLIRTKKMFFKTTCICINWTVIGLCYFGVAQYMGQIGGNMFVNIFISGVIQIPANLLCIYLMDVRWLGRKGTLILHYILCAVALLVIAVCDLLLDVDQQPSWLTPTMGCLGMMAISVTFSVIYVFAGELFPTLVRNVGMGTASMFARFGSMVAPFVAKLGDHYVWLPPAVFGLAPIVAVVLSIYLPETLGCNLPDTLTEADKIGTITEPSSPRKIEK